MRGESEQECCCPYCILKLSQALSVDNLFYIILNIHQISLQKKLIIFSVGASRVRMLSHPGVPQLREHSREKMRVVLHGLLQFLQECRVCGIPRSQALLVLQTHQFQGLLTETLPSGLSKGSSINEEFLSWKGKHFPPSSLPGLGAAFPRAHGGDAVTFHGVTIQYYCSSHLLKHFQHKLIFSHISPLVFHYTIQNFSFKKMSDSPK